LFFVFGLDLDTFFTDVLGTKARATNVIFFKILDEIIENKTRLYKAV
jgi:hypothetical protein